MKTKLLLVIALLFTAAVTIKAQTNFAFKSPVWLTSGNKNTNPATNFLGTTDGKDLVFRTSNMERLRITKGGNVGVGIANPQQKLDVNGNINIANGSGFYIDNTRIIHVTGTTNFFAGEFAGNSITTGFNNSVFGNHSMYSNTTGKDNTAVGHYALYSNTTAFQNTAIGSIALYSNTTGYNNTSVGFAALNGNTTGYGNTATGDVALVWNTTGIYNTANGQAALYLNSTGSYNTATGRGALLSNTTGYQNTANGSEALYYNTTGIWNVASGAYALYSNTTGYENSAHGYQALYFNTKGYQNAANGYLALHLNTVGNKNTADGIQALYANETGNENTAIGNLALLSNTNGSFNTAAGSLALNFNTIGKKNTAIGNNADVNTGDLKNSTAIGNEALITASNQVRIGNNNVTSIGGYADWTNISDARVKKNIKENVPGLSFINKLKPITYNLDLGAADKIVQHPAIKTMDGKIIESSNEDATARKAKEQILYTGFIAQDVEKAAKELNYDFSGVDAPKNDKDLYGLRYAEFVVPLVKAVQELSAKNDALEDNNRQLEKRIEKLETLLNAQSSNPSSQLLENLNTNVFQVKVSPNPFQSILNINFNKTASQKTINIYDVNGKPLLTKSANGNTQIDLKQLTAGTYLIKINDESGKVLYNGKVIKQ